MKCSAGFEMVMDASLLPLHYGTVKLLKVYNAGTGVEVLPNYQLETPRIGQSGVTSSLTLPGGGGGGLASPSRV